MNILDQKLSLKNRSEILFDLFGMEIIDGVLYDVEGNEFYGFEENHSYTFTTLRDCFKYMEDETRKSATWYGRRQLQKELQNLLDIESNL